MTTLNNHIRDTIINAAINAAYDKKFKDIAEEEHEVGMALYAASFKKKTLEVAGEEETKNLLNSARKIIFCII